MACKDKERDARIIANLAKRKKQVPIEQNANEINIEWEGDLQLWEVYIEPDIEIKKIEKTETGWIANCMIYLEEKKYRGQ